MQDMIKKIIEMDKEARRLTDEAKQRRAGASAAAEHKRREVFESYLCMAKDRVETIRKVETESAAQEISAMNEKSAQAVRKLNEHYELNAERWVDELVARVVRGDDMQ